MQKLKKAILLILTSIFTVAAIPTIEAGASTISIPSSARQYRGHYYKVYKETVTWDKAQQRCEAKGGHLVTMTSAGEATFVESLTGKYKNYWIGVQKINGKWKWVTGEKFSYHLFVESGSEYEPCAYLTNGYWEVNSSDWIIGGGAEVSYYICEWDTSTATVLPDQVKLSSVKKATSNSIILSWKKVSGVKGYAIYMKKGKNGKYKKIKDIKSGNITTYYKAKLKRKNTYYFRVRAYKNIYGERSYGELSAEKKIKLK